MHVRYAEKSDRPHYSVPPLVILIGVVVVACVGLWLGLSLAGAV